MIKQKAPKNMSSSEFVDYVEKHLKKNLEDINGNVFDETVDRAIIDFLHERLEEPVPNPFTPDQIAWMREEQRGGYNYAAMDENKTFRCYMVRPEKIEGKWTSAHFNHAPAQNGFLSKVLSWDDTEPLCFWDYAPLEGEPT